MGKGGILGEFEQIVLLSIHRLGDEAFGRRVFEELERLSVAPVTITAVYVTLTRLAEKDYVSFDIQQPAQGGRAQKRFHLGSEGLAALQRSREQLDRFWAGVELDREAGS